MRTGAYETRSFRMPLQLFFLVPQFASGDLLSCKIRCAEIGMKIKLTRRTRVVIRTRKMTGVRMKVGTRIRMTIMIIAKNNTSFSVKFAARVFFYQCQVNSRLVTILTSQVFFNIFFFLNLVDRDLTEHQITQTLTLSRLLAQLEQTRGIRLFTHTQHVDWSRQGNLIVHTHATR